MDCQLPICLSSSLFICRIRAFIHKWEVHRSKTSWVDELSPAAEEQGLLCGPEADCFIVSRLFSFSFLLFLSLVPIFGILKKMDMSF